MCRWIACVLVFAWLIGGHVKNAPAQGFNPPGNIAKSIEDAIKRSEQQRQEFRERMREAMQPSRPEPNTEMPRPGSLDDLFSIPASSDPLTSGGLRIQAGTVKHSNGESVLVRDDDGKEVVGRLHVSVGDSDLVLLPDGYLKTYPHEETRQTVQSFVPLDMDAMQAKLMRDPRLAEFKFIRSRRFLYVYNTSEIFIRSSRAILESMYPAVRKYFDRSGIEVHEPEMPMVVIAFANDKQFQDYRPMPKGVVAYYDGISNSVLLYEQSKLSDHAPEIATKNAISTIAHEGAHQILHNIGVQQRLSRWPLWLSEGLAEFYAPTSVQKGVRWSGLGSTNQLRMMEISRDWKANAPQGNGETLKRITSASQLDSLDYAYAWGLIHTLSRGHQKELFACIRQCSELRPLDGSELTRDSSPTSAEIFETHFGTQYASLEVEMNRHLNSLDYVDPLHHQTHYLVVSGGLITLTSSPEKVKEIQRKSFGRCQVQSFPNRAAAERAMKAIAQ